MGPVLLNPSPEHTGQVVTLLDGFTSYLGDVDTAAALETAWQVG